jgi:hypothetical protein
VWLQVGLVIAMLLGETETDDVNVVPVLADVGVVVKALNLGRKLLSCKRPHQQTQTATRRSPNQQPPPQHAVDAAKAALFDIWRLLNTLALFAVWDSGFYTFFCGLMKLTHPKDNHQYLAG